MFAKVIVDISNSNVDKIFDYDCGGLDVRAGCRVVVPFGKFSTDGFVVALSSTSELDETKIKKITEIIDDEPVISAEMLELMAFMIEKYNLKKADVLRLFIPTEMRTGKAKPLVVTRLSIAPEYQNADKAEFIKPSATNQNAVFDYLLQNGEVEQATLARSFSMSAINNLKSRGIIRAELVRKMRTPYNRLMQGEDKIVELTAAQANAVEKICAKENQTFLLHGVTGSGKTEIYMRVIEEALKKNKTAIMLVPEISLTPQVLRIFRSRFGSVVAILHSGLSAGQRFDEWKRLLNGEATVAIGARSAVFAPLSDVGVIIIDEEHDSSYISESNPRYDTEKIAEFRKAYNGCNLVKGSATPSIDSYYAASKGTYELIELTERINKNPLPATTVVDMRKELYCGNNSCISNELRSRLCDCLEQKNQAMLFINRRGYASFVMCRACGYTAKCTSCDVSLVYHRDESTLKCHYCNNRYAMLDVCPNCKSPHIRQGFAGTQRIVETLKTMFPSAKVLRMDNDSTQGRDAHLDILQQFASGGADILVGTQMIAKGHDFSNVTLVGIIDADISLHFSDYRASERTFQLITQVSGRAGRDKKQGFVILQTYSPNHYVYKYAVENNYLGIFRKECNLREVTKYPPFSVIVRILTSGENDEKLYELTSSIFDEIRQINKKYPRDFFYLGAMKSPIKRIKDKFRYQVLMRLSVEMSDNILKEIYNIINRYNSGRVSCFTEINPSSLS